MTTIGFAGLSHLGLVSGITIASRGFKVIGFDPNAGLVADLTKKKLPVFEPDLEEALKAAGEKISFTSDARNLSACDVTYISLDVKTNANNESDLSGLTALIEQIRPCLKKGSTLVILSQVHPGFTRKLAAKIPKTELNVHYQVETLIFGRAVERALKPERYMIGCADPKSPLPAPYQELLSAFGCPILPMRYESAELAKISINLYLVSTVTVTNTLAEICEQIGADWNEIAPSLRLDKRIGPHAYLTPGLGIAGGNLERDLMTVKKISAEHATESGVVDAWLLNSRYRRDWALRTLHERVLSKKSQSKVAVLGVAYKQDTKSIKNSPSVYFLRALSKSPEIEVWAYDPQVKEIPASEPPVARLRFADDALQACREADAVILMTPWGEFKTFNLSELARTLRQKIVIDPHALLSEEKCLQAGIEYYTLGRTPEKRSLS